VSVGDRVACGGAGWANHADLVVVPKHLIARVPPAVPLEAAAYATVGAIALHGVRLSRAAVGEAIGVIGLGLVGQLIARILDAAGCRVFGFDTDPAAVALAENPNTSTFLVGDPRSASAILAATDGIGLDAVLIAAASKSASPVELAAELARDRARIVIVGDVPVQAPRALLYDKELEVVVSRSYGPGRYDRDYETYGKDLPPGYVRWTEQRNLQAFVGLIGSGKLWPMELTTHTYPVAQAADAYDTLTRRDGERAFGVLLDYAADRTEAPRAHRPRVAAPGTRVGLIGAGSFARSTLIPGLAAEGVSFSAVATASGLTAVDVARRYGFDRATDSADAVIEADDVDAVVIATRHASHAPLAIKALQAGKSVFVEKPLALRNEELDELEAALASAPGFLMVGFNRRYAPLTERLRTFIGGSNDLTLLARVNAGALPSDHWLNDPLEGGGRLLGECCHFVDLMCYLAESPVSSVYADAVPPPGGAIESAESFSITLRFASGALGTVLYAGTGEVRLGKERIEAFGAGVSAVIDDFRRLEWAKDGRRRTTRGGHDKGHRKQLAHFAASLSGRCEPAAAASYIDSSRATLAAVESLKSGLRQEFV
jgi:predicted dehydrogenase/threonine dehydrogenase-like Zn-dependent dehydrogenase